MVLFLLPALPLAAEQPAGETSDVKVSFFGSSVCNGEGAEAKHGYAWQLDTLWQGRFLRGESDILFYRSNISINGNNTINLLDRYDRDLIPDSARFVVIGLGLGNEGLHNSPNRDSVYGQWRDNMQLLIHKMQEDGKIVVVTNNYPRGDYDSIDYEYICRMNLEMQRWNIPTVNFLGMLNNLKQHGRWRPDHVVPGDIWHPNTLGHTAMRQAFVPGFFEALASGKPVPTYRPSKGTKLNRDQCIELHFDQAERYSYLYYQNGKPHLEFSDGGEVVRLTGRISQLMVYRGFLTVPEMEQAIYSLGNRAPMLTSSLELYCPLDRGDLTNFAQSSAKIEISTICK